MKAIKLIRDILLNSLFPQTNVYTACLAISESDLSHLLKISESKTPIHTTSLFRYRDKDISTLIKGLKYYGFRHGAEMFGHYLGEYLLEELSDEQTLGTFTSPLLIPVPISQSKKIERGYNQSDLLVKHTAKQLRMAFPTLEIAYDAMKRLGATTPQAHVDNKTERKGNVSNQFIVVNRGKVKGRNIILIDDVITTGSTIKEVSDVLYSAGAKEVRALVVAH